MSLLELKDYLQHQKTANLWQIAKHFDSDPDAVQAMLQHWIRKGKVICKKKTPACGKTCFQCLQEFIETYIWQD